jgi:hypothetical protein
MEKYEIWDHHGERRTEAGNMEGTNAPEVREDDNAHRVMMHDGPGDDVAGGDGGEGCGGGEGYGGEDDGGGEGYGGGEGCGGEDDEEDEEEDFLDDMLRHVQQELLLKGLDNMEMVRKAREERLYPEEKGCEKRWSMLRFVLDILILKAKYGWSDRSFNDLLTLLASMIPKPNFVPTNMYRARKLISPLTIGVERIYACPNHCIIYRGGVQRPTEVSNLWC